MEGIILNLVLTGVLFAFLLVFISQLLPYNIPKKLGATITFLFFTAVSVSFFGTIILIWI